MARVLVVDDDSRLLRSLARMLSTHYQVVTAPSAEHAVLLLDDECFDVVITDQQMPGHDGLWLLVEVRQRQPGAVRVLTSGDDPPQLTRHLQSGLVQYWVPKPALTKDLLACLDAAVA